MYQHVYQHVLQNRVWSGFILMERFVVLADLLCKANHGEVKSLFKHGTAVAAALVAPTR